MADMADGDEKTAINDLKTKAKEARDAFDGQLTADEGKLKSDYESAKGVFDNAEKGAQAARKAAEKAARETAYTDSKALNDKNKQAYDDAEAQLKIWADAKKTSTTNEEWEENHKKW